MKSNAFCAASRCSPCRGRFRRRAAAPSGSRTCCRGRRGPRPWRLPRGRRHSVVCRQPPPWPQPPLFVCCFSKYCKPARMARSGVRDRAAAGGAGLSVARRAADIGIGTRRLFGGGPAPSPKAAARSGRAPAEGGEWRGFCGREPWFSYWLEAYCLSGKTVVSAPSLGCQKIVRLRRRSQDALTASWAALPLGRSPSPRGPGG